MMIVMFCKLLGRLLVQFLFSGSGLSVLQPQLQQFVETGCEH